MRSVVESLPCDTGKVLLGTRAPSKMAKMGSDHMMLIYPNRLLIFISLKGLTDAIATSISIFNNHSQSAILPSYSTFNLKTGLKPRPTRFQSSGKAKEVIKNEKYSKWIQSDIGSSTKRHV